MSCSELMRSYACGNCNWLLTLAAAQGMRLISRAAPALFGGEFGAFWCCLVLLGVALVLLGALRCLRYPEMEMFIYVYLFGVAQRASNSGVRNAHQKPIRAPVVTCGHHLVSKHVQSPKCQVWTSSNFPQSPRLPCQL